VVRGGQGRKNGKKVFPVRARKKNNKRIGEGKGGRIGSGVGSLKKEVNKGKNCKGGRARGKKGLWGGDAKEKLGGDFFSSTA